MLPRRHLAHRQILVAGRTRRQCLWRPQSGLLVPAGYGLRGGGGIALLFPDDPQEQLSFRDALPAQTGIHTPDRGYGFRARRFASPRNDKQRDAAAAVSLGRDQSAVRRVPTP